MNSVHIVPNSWHNSPPDKFDQYVVVGGGYFLYIFSNPSCLQEVFEVLQPAPSPVPLTLLNKTEELEEHTEYLQLIYWLVHSENMKYEIYLSFGRKQICYTTDVI